MALRLYRRHRKECEAGPPEDFKSGEFEEGRRGWKRKRETATTALSEFMKRIRFVNAIEKDVFGKTLRQFDLVSRLPKLHAVTSK